MSDQPATRFDLVPNYRCGGVIDEMEVSDDGEWMRYEDHERLLAAQLAATHAAIRALPRCRLIYNPVATLVRDDANGQWVAWSDVARLLGDPAQEQP